MGICTTTNKGMKQKNNPSQQIKEKTEYLEKTYENENENNKFPDMPIWGNNIVKGFGIKRMPGYKCDLKIDELIKLRDQFWASKKTNKGQWKIIHQACIFDHIKGEDYLYKNKIKTVDGCINECIDSKGNIYKVPNYCINDPYFELEILPKDNLHNEIIEVKLIDISNQRNIEIKVNESEKGSFLIQTFANQYNIDLNKFVIRLLFGGGIIKENDSLYQHKVKDGYIIQICVAQKN